MVCQTSDEAAYLAARFRNQIEEATSHPILQELLCLSLPFVNAELESFGLPAIPPPAFCSTPTT